MNEKIIAVTGATGQQGKAVVGRLLADGWKVRGLTRDSSKPAARELAAAGAEMAAGDMDKRSELDAAFKGAYGVFSVQNYWIPTVGFDGEIRQGKNVADAAKAAGVKHLVYSSVGAAQRGMGQKHFETKWIIEQYIHSLGVPYTVLRPAAFMENFNWNRALILNGALPGRGTRSEKATQIIAVEDIAAFVAVALRDPHTYLGRTIELSGDELTDAQAAQIFAKVIGRPVVVTPPSGSRRNVSEAELKAMFNFFNGEGYSADIPALRKVHPGLLTLEQYLRKNGWENTQPIAMPKNPG